MLASTFYDKALSNFKTAKILFAYAKDDEEQLNAIGYHLQQTVELMFKHILSLNGVAFQKTHDLDQLIAIAAAHNVDLHLTDFLNEKADVITLWESKTRYVMGFHVESKRIEMAINEIELFLYKLKDVEVL